MAKIEDLDNAYLDMASIWGSLSYAERKKVGCLIVKDGQIISDGYNGTPTGLSNVCEDESGKTLEIVIHAESNALMKLAKGTSSSQGATMYLTLSPCFDCAKLIKQAGVNRVVYREEYRKTEGLEFLRTTGIKVVHLP